MPNQGEQKAPPTAGAPKYYFKPIKGLILGTTHLASIYVIIPLGKVATAYPSHPGKLRQRSKETRRLNQIVFNNNIV